jgi:hypothetical protein
MAMRRCIPALLVAGFAALASSSAVRAGDDTIRLGTSGTFGGVTGEDDMELVRGRGGFGGGGFRGGFGGFRGGFGGFRGGVVGFRGGFGGFRGGFVGFRGGFGGFRGGFVGFRGGFGGSFVQPFVYYRPFFPVVYSQPIYYWPCGSEITVNTPSVLAQLPLDSSEGATNPYQFQSAAARPQLLPMPGAVPPGANGNQTFPYDGGPASPLPLPRPGNNGIDGQPTPQPTIPLSGKVVSASPNQVTGGTSQFTSHLISASTVSAPEQPSVNRFSYPAYGDQSLPSVRKQSR